MTAIPLSKAIGAGGGNPIGGTVTFPINSDDLITTGSGEIYLKTGVVSTDIASYPDAPTSLHPELFPSVSSETGYESLAFTSRYVGTPDGIAWDGTYYWILANNKMEQLTSAFVPTGVMWSVEGDGCPITVNIVDSMCYDGTSFYIASWTDSTVYKFSYTGEYLTSYNVAAQGDGLRSIAWTGTYFFVTFLTGNTLKRYTSSMVYSAAANETSYSNTYGIAFDGTYVVCFNNTGMYRKYNAVTGAEEEGTAYPIYWSHSSAYIEACYNSTESKFIISSGNTGTNTFGIFKLNPTTMVWDGVTDHPTLFKKLTGPLESSEVYSVCFDGTFFWVLFNDGMIYKYNSSWVYQSVSIDVSANSLTPRGICWNGTDFIVYDQNGSGELERYNSSWVHQAQEHAAINTHIGATMYEITYDSALDRYYLAANNDTIYVVNSAFVYQEISMTLVGEYLDYDQTNNRLLGNAAREARVYTLSDDGYSAELQATADWGDYSAVINAQCFLTTDGAYYWLLNEADQGVIRYDMAFTEVVGSSAADNEGGQSYYVRIK